MFEERDYVMRIVQQIAVLFARVLKLKHAKSFDEAAEMLTADCESILGIDFKTLSFVDSQSGAALLNDVHRIRTFAQLLEELASVHRESGDEARARARERHALEMFIEAQLKKPDDAQAREGIERLRSRVDLTQLAPRYTAQLNR